MDIPIIPVKPKNDLEEAIAEIALIFDFTATKSIEYKDLGTIIRFLGCAATEADIKEICKATEFKEFPQIISIKILMEHVTELVMQEKMKPANVNQLLKAFQNLDKDNKGSIDSVYFSELMLNEGERLTKSELNKMMRKAIDPKTGLIEYEFYMNKLLEKDQKIYVMAEKISKKREAINAAKESN